MISINNPCPHTDPFLRCCSRQIMKTFWQKKKIAHKEEILLLPQCFQIFSVISLLFLEVFHIFNKTAAADLLHTHFSKSAADYFLKNIVAKGEIAHDEKSNWAISTLDALFFNTIDNTDTFVNKH